MIIYLDPRHHPYLHNNHPVSTHPCKGNHMDVLRLPCKTIFLILHRRSMSAAEHMDSISPVI